jgi:hypothetical protein
MKTLHDQLVALLARFKGGEAAEARIDLAAGRPVEIARAGTFQAYRGGAVTVTPAMLEECARNSTAPVPLKLGHEELTTASPDLGKLANIRVDAGILVGDPAPTEYGRSLNATGAYRFCSPEIRKDSEHGWTVDAVGLLGAWEPADTGKRDVALAAAKDGDKVILLGRVEEEEPSETTLEPDLFLGISAAERKKIPSEDFAGPGNSFPIRNQKDVIDAADLLHHAKDPSAVKAKIVSIAKKKGLRLPATWSQGANDPEDAIDHGADESTEKMSAPMPGLDVRKESEMTDQEQIALAKAQATKDRERLLQFAGEDAKRFLAANTEKIGLAARTAGAEALLVELARISASGHETVNLAADKDGKIPEIDLYALAQRVLLAGPAQLKAGDKKEVATEDAAADLEESDVPKLAMGGVKTSPDGDQKFLAIQKEIQNEKAKTGKVLDFNQAADRLASRAAR